MEATGSYQRTSRGVSLLALDLANQCGAALFVDGQLVRVESWELHKRSGRSEGGGVRFLRLELKLDAVREERAGARLVLAFENVTGFYRSKGRPAASRARELYAGYKATLQRWGEKNAVPYVPVHTSAVKQTATGKGSGKGTGKDAIVRAARLRWPRFSFPDDNAADAAFVGAYAWRDLFGKVPS